MDTNETTDFLVVGAGLAGLAFARDMQAKGATVRLLDKGRGIGGRMATRRMGDVIVDHGAQYFTARSDRLKTLIAEGERDGWIHVWSNGFPLWENGLITSRPAGHPRYAPPAGMNAVAKHLGEGLAVDKNTTVVSLSRETDGTYSAEASDGQQFAGRGLILNLPPAQLLPLAGHLLPEETRAQVATVAYLPAWSLGLRLEGDLAGADWPAVEFKDHPVLGWVSRDHTKRKAGAPPVLMIHGAGNWSSEHLEDDPEEVQAALLNAAREVFGPFSFGETLLHRWRYSLPTQTAEAPCLWDNERRIGACGDWCDGPRVEGAIVSGWKLAEAAG